MILKSYSEIAGKRYSDINSLLAKHNRTGSTSIYKQQENEREVIWEADKFPLKLLSKDITNMIILQCFQISWKKLREEIVLVQLKITVHRHWLKQKI